MSNLNGLYINMDKLLYFLYGIAVGAAVWYVSDLHRRIKELSFVLDNINSISL